MPSGPQEKLAPDEALPKLMTQAVEKQKRSPSLAEGRWRFHPASGNVDQPAPRGRSGSGPAEFAAEHGRNHRPAATGGRNRPPGSEKPCGWRGNGEWQIHLRRRRRKNRGSISEGIDSDGRRAGPMVARTNNMNSAARLGVQCPSCGRCELFLRPGGQGCPTLACSACGTFARLLRRHGDPLPGYEPRVAGSSEYAHDAPAENCWWIGLVRARDGLFRAVCPEQDTRGLLGFPVVDSRRGDRLMMPMRPAAGKVAYQDAAAPSRRTKS